jgi:hypothetical protein
VAGDVLSSDSTLGEGCDACGDARQAKPHLEHNPLSLLGTCHATPMRKLNDPDIPVGRLQHATKAPGGHLGWGPVAGYI